MALGPRLDLRQTQSLVMTPQLQQAIKLLAASNLEIESFIAEALEANPLLETPRPRRYRSRSAAKWRWPFRKMPPADQLIALGGGEGRCASLVPSRLRGRSRLGHRRWRCRGGCPRCRMGRGGETRGGDFGEMPDWGTAARRRGDADRASGRVRSAPFTSDPAHHLSSPATSFGDCWMMVGLSCNITGGCRRFSLGVGLAGSGSPGLASGANRSILPAWAHEIWQNASPSRAREADRYDPLHGPR